MPKDAEPVFEVAAIKLSDPNDHSQGFQIRGRHVKVQNENVISMIMFAYGIHNKQVVNGPDWIKDQHFDVDGVPDVEGEPNLKQMQHIVQNLLVERFGLKFHEEKRELAVYAIAIDKGGVKMQKSKSPETQAPDQTGNGGAHKQFMRYTNNTVDDFALSMQYFLDKPVVNQTCLAGRYDFALTWNPDLTETNEADVPGLFTAMKEQIGLKMEPTHAQVNVMVVDALSKPTEN